LSGDDGGVRAVAGIVEGMVLALARLESMWEVLAGNTLEVGARIGAKVGGDAMVGGGSIVP
jgi:hypothetical protein